MTKKDSLVLIAHDGKKFHYAVIQRLKGVGRHISELIEKAGIDASTAWRWSQGSKPELDTVHRIEKVLNRRDLQASAANPSAR